MLGKKLMASVVGSGLLWAAGLTGHAALASHPGLLMVAGQLRLSLGDKEGGLRLMERAAAQDQASEPEQVAAQPAAAVSPVKCPADAEARRVSPRSPDARQVRVIVEVPPARFAATLARRHRELVRLSLEQARLDDHVRALVMQQMHDLPPVPAASREPVGNTP